MLVAGYEVDPTEAFWLALANAVVNFFSSVEQSSRLLSKKDRMESLILIAPASLSHHLLRTEKHQQCGLNFMAVNKFLKEPCWRWMLSHREQRVLAFVMFAPNSC